MKKIFCLLFLAMSLIGVKGYSQHVLKAVILDEETQAPVPYATVHNELNYAISNDDGGFYIESTANPLTIECLGYETLKTSFTELKGKSKIYLKPKTFELEAITLTAGDPYTLMKKAAAKWYALSPHKERFFMRGLLRKNGEIEKLIDLTGKIEKNTLFSMEGLSTPKDNYRIELENARLASVNTSKKYYIKMMNFEGLLNSVASLWTPADKYSHTYSSGNDSLSAKLDFAFKDAKKKNEKGHYLLKKGQYTFDQLYLIFNNPDGQLMPFGPNLKTRTLKFEKRSDFALNEATGKYQLSKAYYYHKVEVVSKEGTDVFDLYYFYTAEPLPSEEPVTANVSAKMDMFQLKRAYNPEFWEHTDILLLTDEMRAFIDKVNSSKEPRSISNFK